MIECSNRSVAASTGNKTPDRDVHDETTIIEALSTGEISADTILQELEGDEAIGKL